MSANSPGRNLSAVVAGHGKRNLDELVRDLELAGLMDHHLVRALVALAENMATDLGEGVASAAAPAPTHRAAVPAVNLADWLARLLAAGPMASSEVIARAVAAGYAKRTVQFAAKSMGVQQRRVAAFGGGSEWSLPPPPARRSRRG